MIVITINGGVLRVEKDYQEIFKLPLTKDEAQVLEMAGSSVSAANPVPASVMWPGIGAAVELPMSFANADGSRQWVLYSVSPGTATFDIGEFTMTTNKWAAYYWLKQMAGESPVGVLRMQDRITNQIYAESELGRSPRIDFIIGDAVPVNRPLVVQVEILHYDASEHPDLILQTGVRWKV